jgi:hypothetical protein
MQRLPRLIELLLIVALCSLVAFWITRVMRGTLIAVPPVATTAAGNANSRVDEVLASARLFGSRRPGVLSDNVRPMGVVADASGRGSVIVSIDGQPPKVYRVGDTLDGRLVSAIRPEEIELESGGARQVFRLPASRPSIGGLTVLGTGPRPTTYPAQTPQQVLQPPPGAATHAAPTMPPARGMSPDQLRAIQHSTDNLPPPPPAGLDR